MDLFNKYKNKDFTYIVNYINSVLSNEEALSAYKLKQFFTETKSFNEVIKYVINKNNSILEKREDNLIYPKYDNDIIMALTYDEKIWLYDILSDPKAELFLEKDVINKIKEDIEESANKIFKLTDNILVIKKLNNTEPYYYSNEEIGIFRKILQAAYDKKYISLYMKKDDHGEVCYNENIIPYKIEYNQDDDTFNILCYNHECNYLKYVPLLSIKKVKISGNISDYKNMEKNIQESLNKLRCSSPVVLEIEDMHNSFQRCTYKFAPYERIMYEKNKKIYMEIYYYNGRQYDEIITYIMQLGKYVKVVSPADIVFKIKEEIMAKSEIYK